MGGFTDPWYLLAATSSVAGLWVLLLFAYRRIPRLPSPDSISELRYDFLALAEQFQEFTEKHDTDMGRYHAKVGQLRRKLRKLQEEEGVFDEDDEGEIEPAEAAPPPVLTMPSREEQKRAALLASKRRQGVA